MTERHLSDNQWCLLDLLMRSRERGVHSINRMELLGGQSVLPMAASMKLAWAALSMPLGLVKWTSKHDFSITEEGVTLYNLRFGNGANPAPTRIADSVIALPDLSARH